MSGQEIEKKGIEALYYLHNQGFPAIKDESSFQKVRLEFLSLFPEFSADVPEKFDSVKVESGRTNIHDILRQLPREKKIWSEELVIRIDESMDLAHKVLTRNMRELLNEEFPLPLSGDNAINAYEKLASRLAEKKANVQSMSLAERGEYDRAEMEVDLAWGIVLMHAFLLANYKEPTVDINELFCLVNQIGRTQGLLTTLDPNYVANLKEAYSRIKGSEVVVEGRWKSQQEKKEKAAIIAADLWKKGDKALHTEMADFLFGSIKYDEIRGLSRQNILEAIKPAAKDHNRLFGTKGVRKDK